MIKDCEVQLAEKDAVLLQSLRIEYRKWFVVDFLLENENGRYWSCYIFERNELVYRKYEYSDIVKTPETLKKELFKYLGERKL